MNELNRALLEGENAVDVIATELFVSAALLRAVFLVRLERAGR